MTIIDASNDVVFTSSIYHVDPQKFSVYRWEKIRCSSALSDVHYDLLDPSIPLTIDAKTGELASKEACPTLDEVLIRCTEDSARKKTAYAKLTFDQICRANSQKQSTIDWINRIGQERRKRIHYQSVQTLSVSNRLFLAALETDRTKENEHEGSSSDSEAIIR